MEGRSTPKHYFPTLLEMKKGLSHYVQKIESQGAHCDGGIAKITSPPEYVARKSGYKDIGDRKIGRPVRQSYIGKNGVYTICSEGQKPMTVKGLFELEEQPHFESTEVSVRKYWEDGIQRPHTYGADVNDSLFDKGAPWNLSKLDTMLDIHNVEIEGVNTSYLYFGNWASSFPWHVEDQNLYSINYLHFGSPKIWYTVRPQDGHLLEALIRSLYPGLGSECQDFIRHKINLISPANLEKYGIPYSTTVQNPGDFIVTFPFGYHCGFNTGNNCAEAINFATPRWIPYGKSASHCTCNTDAIFIQMDPFIKLFQSEDEYRDWLTNGNKCAPPDHNWCPPEPSNFQSWTKIRDDRMIEVNRQLEKSGKPKLTLEEYLHPSVPMFPDAENHNPFKGLVATFYDLAKLNGDQPPTAWRQIHEDIASKLGLSTDGYIHGDEVSARLYQVRSRHREEGEKLERIWNMSKRVNPKYEDVLEINEEQGTMAPFCSLCHVVKRKSKITAVFDPSPVKRNEVIRDDKSRFPQSDVLIPEINFEMKKASSATEVSVQLDEPSCVSPLLDCGKCQVRIHAKCWGLSAEELKDLEDHPEKEWTCDSCQEECSAAIICFICRKTTGALKKVSSESLERASSSQWAHLECVLATPGVCFGDVTKRRDIRMEDLNPKTKLSCFYCKKRGRSKKAIGYAVMCCGGGCKGLKYFHVTCARDRGHLIEAGNWPYALNIYCKKCEGKSLDYYQIEEKSAPLKRNDEVTVKNGGGELAVVTAVKTVSKHMVYFADESVSSDVYQEHFCNYNWNKYPKMCSQVSIDWGGYRYSGIYYGFSLEDIAQVKYKDGTTGELLRNELYGPDEQAKSSGGRGRKRRKTHGENLTGAGKRSATKEDDPDQGDDGACPE